MEDRRNKDLKVKEKKELTPHVEQTRPGRVFTPTVDIFENDKAIVLLADMPGVKADKLNIDLKENTLTINGRIAHESRKDKAVFMEYETGNYYRQFSLSEVIDQSKINASLKEGVLTLTLPKQEKASPRKITIQSV